jgi:hypothetical protein
MVAVVWEDIKTLDGGAWVETKTPEVKPHIVCQVGFLLKKTRTHVLITQAWHPELMSPPDQIPRKVIRSLTHLEPKKG